MGGLFGFSDFMLMQGFSGVVPEGDGEGGWGARRAGFEIDVQKATAWRGVRVRLSDVGLGIVRFRIARRSTQTGVLFVQRATGKLAETVGMDGLVFPMPITAEDEEGCWMDGTGFQPFEKGLGFVIESLEIGVVVGFRSIVGSEHGSGRDQDFEGGIVFLERALQPFALFFSPERLFRTIGHVVRAAVITALDEPELEILTHAVGSVGRLVRPRLQYRDLFPEGVDP